MSVKSVMVEIAVLVFYEILFVKKGYKTSLTKHHTWFVLLIILLENWITPTVLITKSSKWDYWFWGSYRDKNLEHKKKVGDSYKKAQRFLIWSETILVCFPFNLIARTIIMLSVKSTNCKEFLIWKETVLKYKMVLIGSRYRTGYWARQCI